MGQDNYLPLKKSGQSVIGQNLPYPFLRGQPLNYVFISLSFFNCVSQYPFLGMIIFELCFDWWTPFNQTRDTVF